MADHLKEPTDAQVTSTKQSLGKGPEDMPKWGAGQGQVQTTSERVNLSRAENRVAAFGAHPNQGSVTSTSTQCDLSRKANSPYDHISKTTPQEDL